MKAPTKKRVSKPAPRRAAVPAAKVAKPKVLSVDEAHGELRQLATIRHNFDPLPIEQATAMQRAHDETTCRERGTGTRAAETFGGAMAWARTIGEHPDDLGFPEMPTRWFLDCLTALGQLLVGIATHENPSSTSTLADAEHTAEEVLDHVFADLKHAIGTNGAWRHAFESILAPEPPLDPTVTRLRKAADLIAMWTDEPADAPPLGMFGLDRETVNTLRDTAQSLTDAIATRPATRQIERDGPDVNAAEGRLYFAMRVVWDQLARARQKGTSALQLTITPALMRGLNLNARHKKPAVVPAA